MIDDFDRFASREQRRRGRPKRTRPGGLIAMAVLLVVVLVGILFIMLRFSRG